MHETITIKGARLHNLKSITVSIPKNKLVVLTGLSGSGKSTLAFDTLHKEGQRQYMESMGMVTEYVSKPKVDSITGLSPSISVDQHLTNRSPRSTVGTATEIFTYLRVLFARLGHRTCPACGVDVPPSLDVQGTDAWDDEPDEREVDDTPDTEASYPCPECGTSIPELGMAHFSFNKPAGACSTDQAAIGRTPRSNAATFTDAFTPIRQTFATTPAARDRKLKAGHFSFNVAGGRCERCQGAGLLTVSMHSYIRRISPGYWTCFNN